MLATGPHAANEGFAVMQANMILQLADTAKIYTQGNEKLTAAVQEALKTSTEKISVESRRIQSMRMAHPEQDESSEIILTLEDGTEIEEAFLVSFSQIPCPFRVTALTSSSQQHAPACELTNDFQKQLSLGLSETGDFKVAAPFPETETSGVFAAGDCANPLKAVATAAMQGGMAGVGLCVSLQKENAQAVA